MNEIIEKLLDNIPELAQKFIPSDLSEKIGERMSDANKQYEFSGEVQKIITELSFVKGMTPANSRDLKDSQPIFKLKDGTVISRYVNPARFEHIFISDKNGNCIFGGYVGWIHNQCLLDKEKELLEKYAYYGD